MHGRCRTLFVNAVKRWSCDGGTRNVSRRLSQSVKKGSRALSELPHLMTTRFEYAAASLAAS